MTNITRDQLMESAQYFADLALQAYIEANSREILHNAAVAMEHLSKALLLNMNPAFLAELKNGRFDALLHLTGYGNKAANLDAPKTIGAREALARVRQIIDIRTPRDQLDRLIEIRNGTVHVGDFGSAGISDLLMAFLRYSDEIYDELGTPVDHRWGEHADLVAELVKELRTDSEREFHRKIAAARSHYRQLNDFIPKAILDFANRTSQRQLLALADSLMVIDLSGRPITGELVECPSCRHPDAVCLGFIQERFQDLKRLTPVGKICEGNIHEVRFLVDGYLETAGLICMVCRVGLKGDELRLAGVPPQLKITSRERVPLHVDKVISFLSIPTQDLD